MPNTWKSWGAKAALILCLTVAAYLPALRGGFVFDDHELIAENRMVTASDGLYRAWFTAEADPYYPLSWSLWWLEWRLWDGRPLGYHLVNVLLHAIDAVLVWLILRQLKVPGAWLAAMVFAIHPVNVATVAWISEQKNTLSLLLYALAILLYLRFDEAEHHRQGRLCHQGIWYGLSLVAFVLALLSKTATVMLPVVLLGCVWWRHGRVRRRDWLYSLPYFAISLGLALVIIGQHQRGLPPTFVHTGGLAARLAVAGQIPWLYLSKALVPLNLTVIYPKWEVDPTRWISYVPGAVWLGFFLLCWQKRESWGRPLLFGLGYFVVTLFPVLGFFDQGFYYCTLVADHWQYHSIIGVIALGVAGGRAFCQRLGPGSGSVGRLLGAAVLIALGVATWRRESVYTNDGTLWRDNVAKNPNAWLAQYNLGVDLWRAHRVPEAVAQYERALRIRPDIIEAHYNLGLALAQLGRLPEAIAQYEQALRIWPDYAEVHYALGIALVRVGRVAEAVGHYERALRLKPDYVEAHNDLALALVQLGRLPEAIGHWEQALRLKPDIAEAHYNCGLALARQGRMPEAIGHFEQALRLKPDYANAHNNLALALSQVGRMPEATEHWEQALRLKPNLAEAHYGLGLAREQSGRIREALGHYEQAVRLKTDYPDAQNNLAWLLATLAPADGGDPARAVTLAQRLCEATGNQVAAYLDTLAAAYAAAGRFPEAIASAQMGIDLARAAGQPQVAGEIEGHRQLYREGRAYRR